MLTLLALALASPLPGSSLILRGECIYPPAIAEKVPDAIQLICDTVEIGSTGVDFKRSGWDAHWRFFGSWQGDVLTVTAIQPRNARRNDAKGQCRIDRANGGISLVSCSAFGNGREWVANFRHVRP